MANGQKSGCRFSYMDLQTGYIQVLQTGSKDPARVTNLTTPSRHTPFQEQQTATEYTFFWFLLF